MSIIFDQGELDEVLENEDGAHEFALALGLDSHGLDPFLPKFEPPEIPQFDSPPPPPPLPLQVATRSSTPLRRSPRKRGLDGRLLSTSTVVIKEEPLVQISEFDDNAVVVKGEALVPVDEFDDNGPVLAPWNSLLPTHTAHSSRGGKVRVGEELSKTMALFNGFMGVDITPVEELVVSMRNSLHSYARESKKDDEEPAAPNQEDPIEKRIRLREYKVTEANPTPWKRDFGFPNFKAEILTVVASVSLAVDLDLKYIAERARNIEYNPKRFASLIMRVREPKSAALIFSSGKMVVAGTKTEEECRRAVRKYARVIQKLGFNVSICNFEVQNISASGHLKFGVRVRDMARDELINRFVSYEAEIFPGLVYTLIKPKVKAIIFVTGAILMTGAKSEAEIQEALETIYPIARKHRR